MARNAIICLLLALCVLLGACAPQNQAAAPSVTPEEEPYFEKTYVPLSVEGVLERAFLLEGKLYLFTQTQEVDEYGYPTGETLYYTCAPDGSGLAPWQPPRFTGFSETPAHEDDVWCHYSSFFTLPDGAPYVFATVSYSFYPKDSVILQQRTHFVLLPLGQGEAIELEMPSQDIYLHDALAVDAAGNLYAHDFESVYVFSPAGKLLGQVSLPNSVYDVLTWQGAVYASTFDTNGGGKKLVPIDPETLQQSAAGVIRAPHSDPTFIVSPAGDLYCSTGTMLLSYNKETGAFHKEFTFVNNDVDAAHMAAMTVLEDGTFLIVTSQSGAALAVSSIITLTKAEGENITRPGDLVLACMGLDPQVASLVIAHNQKHPNNRIIIHDYAAYATADAFNAGLVRLSAEIMSGHCPDIVITGEMPMQSFISLGLVEDLWPYIDADAALGGRDALVLPVFEAFSQGGKLYEIAADFCLYTTLAPTRLVGEQMGWSMESFNALRETLPETAYIFGSTYFKLSALTGGFTMLYDTFVDWEAGECYFDSPEFIEFLEFTNTFPAQYTPTMESQMDIVARGDMPIFNTALFASDGMRMWLEAFGEPITPIGYPGANGNGSAFEIQTGFAMMAACEHKDVAWEFLRTLLTREYQSMRVGDLGLNGYIPTNRHVLTADLDEKCEAVTNSAGIVLNDPMTQAERDQFEALLAATTATRYYDDSLMEILHDEAQGYYDGVRSAKEAAKNIQARAELYMAEQR